MEYITKTVAIDRLNSLCQAGTPCFFFVNYAGTKWYVEKETNIDTNDLLFECHHRGNHAMNTLPLRPRPKEILWQPHFLSFKAYKTKLDYVVHQAHLGNTYLANLTIETPLDTNLTLRQIFETSSARYKLWVKDTFTCFSPEIFVRIQGREIATYPMKGTIDAADPLALQTILNDPKESAEHATIVDLLRNDLALVSEKVKVRRYRYAEKIQTNQGAILQMSSEIVGQLPEDWPCHVGEILSTLLPAGSITGAPKKKTCQIIHDVENYDRTFYTGIMGYFDGKTLDTGVMIRYIEQREAQFYFKAGGGITHKSKALLEYNEVKQKTALPCL